MPASVTSSTRSPASSASSSTGVRALPRCPRSRTRPARSMLDPEVGGQPPQPAGVLGGDDVGGRRARRPAAAARRSTRPIGVAASTSTPASGAAWHPSVAVAGSTMLSRSSRAVPSTRRRVPRRDAAGPLDRGRAPTCPRPRSGPAPAPRRRGAGWSAGSARSASTVLALGHAAVAPRHARAVRVRRDLLRQGRVVDAQLRLRRASYVDGADEQILDGTTRGHLDRTTRR